MSSSMMWDVRGPGPARAREAVGRDLSLNLSVDVHNWNAPVYPGGRSGLDMWHLSRPVVQAVIKQASNQALDERFPRTRREERAQMERWPRTRACVEFLSLFPEEEHGPRLVDFALRESLADSHLAGQSGEALCSRYYVFSKWLMSQRAQWVLDEECAKYLYNSPCAVDSIRSRDFDSWLKLPFKALYVELPPVFPLVDFDGVEHPVEAMILAPGRGYFQDAPYTPVNMLEVNILSSFSRKAKSKYRDAVAVFHFIEDAFVNTPLKRFVANFLWALNTRHLLEEKVIPRWPGSSKAAREIKRSGCLMTPHSRIHLLSPRVRLEADRSIESERAEMAAHLVRGHFHCYWVKHPGDIDPIEKKVTAKGKVLYKIPKWLDSYPRGKGTVHPPQHDVAL